MNESKRKERKIRARNPVHSSHARKTEGHPYGIPSVPWIDEMPSLLLYLHTKYVRTCVSLPIEPGDRETTCPCRDGCMFCRCAATIYLHTYMPIRSVCRYMTIKAKIVNGQVSVEGTSVSTTIIPAHTQARCRYAACPSQAWPRYTYWPKTKSTRAAVYRKVHPPGLESRHHHEDDT